LHNILRCGDTDPKKRDLYSQNYRFFLEQCENYEVALVV